MSKSSGRAACVIIFRKQAPAAKRRKGGTPNLSLGVRLRGLESEQESKR